MSRPLRVLIVEDTPADAELVLRKLRRAGFEPDWQRVDSEADYLASLHAGLDVILSDFAMPQFSGLRALEILRERGLEIPFIIVSGTIGEDTAVEVMKQGVTDYLLKDRLTRLGPAIEQALEKGRLRRERKRDEERIREQAAMLDQARDAIIVRGFHDRKISFWNHGAETLYGWSVSEATGRDIGELICVDPTTPDQIRSALLTKDEWRGETRHWTKDGRQLAVNARATLLRDAAGAPKSVLSINTDISEQKNLEAQFLRAQRMESIGTLAAGLAHDLNNILSPIMMSVPILRRHLPAGPCEDIISTIEISAERGAQIIRQVLVFGRGLEGERHPLQIGALIRELWKIMAETFPKNIALEAASEPQLWPVLGDATQLHQVLLNLCVNARDAMPSGGRLRLLASNAELDASSASLLPEAAPGPHVIVEVRDTGTGIGPEILDRIFDPFFTTKGVGGGTGLGLSTVLGIVKSHGGFIRVDTQPGRGTAFQIYLPASPEHEPPPAGLAHAPIPAGRGEFILVVDDEANVREAARLVLEAAGYRVLSAAEGTEALAVFARNSAQIAAVLTDLMMPVMDGVALIHALRSLAPRLPIIASTGLGEKAQRADLKALQVEIILQKPYGPDTLLRTLHAALAAADSPAA